MLQRDAALIALQIHPLKPQFVGAAVVWLQNVVSKSALQFRGNSQHDAQEFLLWLLDRVHEDLNQIINPDSRPPRKVNRL